MLDTSKDNSNATLESLFIRFFMVDETLFFPSSLNLLMWQNLKHHLGTKGHYIDLKHN
jgi:hypothetical protein